MVDSLLSGMTVAGASPDGSAGVGLSDVSVLLPLRDSLTGFELETAELIRVIVGLLDSDEVRRPHARAESAARHTDRLALTETRAARPRDEENEGRGRRRRPRAPGCTRGER
jgi:hypothetical protein